MDVYSYLVPRDGFYLWSAKCSTQNRLDLLAQQAPAESRAAA